MALGLLLVLFMVMSIICWALRYKPLSPWHSPWQSRRAFGALAVIALLVQICGKSERSFLTAKVLVAASVVLGMVALFVI